MVSVRVADDLIVPIGVGSGMSVADSVGDVTGVETSASVGVDGRRVTVGTRESSGVEVSGWDSSRSVSVAIGVRETACVGLGVSRDVDMSLHTYDDIEQYEQIVQAMKKRIT